MSEPVFIDVLNTTGTIRVYLFNTTELEPFNLDNTDIEKFVESVSKTINGKMEISDLEILHGMQDKDGRKLYKYKQNRSRTGYGLTIFK